MLTMMQPATTNPTDTDMLAVKDVSKPSSLLKVRGAGKPTAEKIDHVAGEFESQFVSEMLHNMFNTVDPHESLGGSDAEEVYNSMLVNEYGKIIARTGGVGVADQVKRVMLKQQEVE